MQAKVGVEVQSALRVNSTLYVGGWLTLHSDRFTLWNKLGPQCTGGWVGFRAHLDRCRIFLPTLDFYNNQQIKISLSLLKPVLHRILMTSFSFCSYWEEEQVTLPRN